eukprot:5973098-Pyramimonas_sp.AAC.1
MLTWHTESILQDPFCTIVADNLHGHRYIFVSLPSGLQYYTCKVDKVEKAREAFVCDMSLEETEARTFLRARMLKLWSSAEDRPVNIRFQDK